MSKIADETAKGIVRIEEGNIMMVSDDRECSIYFEFDRVPPLSMDEPHVSIRLVGEEFTTEVELDGHHLERLQDEIALYYEELEEKR